MASAKIAKVKKQTPKKAVETEAEDGKKLNDYEILTTIGKIDNDHLASMNQISNHFEYKPVQQKLKITIKRKIFVYICRDNFVNVRCALLLTSSVNSQGALIN